MALTGNKLQIGIVGSGIAGLTAAWLLNRAGHQVTLFEKQATFGMDAHRVELDLESHPFALDVPPRLFNDVMWPNLAKLYRTIGVESVEVEPSKSFGLLDGRTILKLGATFRPKLSSKMLLDSSLRQIVRDISRMMLTAPRDLQTPLKETMREYLTSRRYSRAFVRQFLYPSLSATVCTCSYAALEDYPARVLLEAMLNLIRPDGLNRTKYGTQDVVKRLSESLTETRFSMNVVGLQQDDQAASIQLTEGDECRFDHVIVATQANSAKRLLGPSRPHESEALGKFLYEKISVVVHTEPKLMPSDRKDWSQFNFLSAADEEAAMCTIWMNEFYPEWGINSDVFQTIMPIVELPPDQVLYRASMQRPVVTASSQEGLEMIRQLHQEPNRRIWLCGSYASSGIPLLESGVVSAINVARRLGIEYSQTVNS